MSDVLVTRSQIASKTLAHKNDDVTEVNETAAGYCHIK